MAKHCKKGPYACTKTTDPRAAFAEACEVRNVTEKRKKTRQANCVMAMMQIIQELSQRYDHTRDECKRLKDNNSKLKEDVRRLENVVQASAAERKLAADQLLEFRRENTQLKQDISDLHISTQRLQNTLKQTKIAYEELWDRSGVNPDRKLARKVREAEQKAEKEREKRKFMQRRVAALGRFPMEEESDSDTDNGDSVVTVWGQQGLVAEALPEEESASELEADKESEEEIHIGIGEGVKLKKRKVAFKVGQKPVAPIITWRVRTPGVLDPQSNRTTYQYQDQTIQREMTLSEMSVLQGFLPKWDGAGDPTPVVDKVHALQRTHNLTNQDCCRLLQSALPVEAEVPTELTQPNDQGELPDYETRLALICWAVGYQVVNDMNKILECNPKLQEHPTVFLRRFVGVYNRNRGSAERATLTGDDPTFWDLVVAKYKPLVTEACRLLLTQYSRDLTSLPPKDGTGVAIHECLMAWEESKMDTPPSAEAKKKIAPVVINEGQSCYNCGRPGHRIWDCKHPTQCRNCRRVGHSWKDCWAKGGGSEGKGPKQSRSQSPLTTPSAPTYAELLKVLSHLRVGDTEKGNEKGGGQKGENPFLGSQ
ncbi:uncharacterized protein LOC135360628 [Latimeria chalumnae]|uniref:uncharacterized protein LOC135360628 n=1 Tax=Latimeria chalumnae TaxID=7897 RepID=UPI00313D0ED2